GGYAVGIIAFHTTEAGPLFGWAGSNAALVVWPIALAVCALAGIAAGLAVLKHRCHIAVQHATRLRFPGEIRLFGDGFYRDRNLRIDRPWDGAGRHGHFKMVCILSVLRARINTAISATLFGGFV
ncbi:hypothetical protein ACOTDU_29855, partial [Achromobacter dolens]